MPKSSYSCPMLFIIFLLFLPLFTIAGCHRATPIIEGTPQVTIRFPNGADMDFVWVDELKVWFSKTEVTLAQFRAYDDDYSTYGYFQTWPGFDSTWPAMNVTDKMAKEFCCWMNRHDRSLRPAGTEFRLPTDYEWARAAMCGTERIFPWGNDFPPTAMADGALPNYGGEDKRFGLPDALWPEPNYKIVNYTDGHAGPAPVLESGKNECGLYGMAGNAAEWCQGSRRHPPKMGQPLLGGSYTTSRAEEMKILSPRHLPMIPYYWFPFVKHRHSDFTTGFRVVLGSEGVVPVGMPNINGN